MVAQCVTNAIGADWRDPVQSGRTDPERVAGVDDAEARPEG